MTSPTKKSQAGRITRSALPELTFAIAAVLLTVGLSGCGSQAAPGGAMPAPAVSVAQVV